MEFGNHENIQYAIRYPEHFDSCQKYPLVFYIHGAGWRGRDITRISHHPYFEETKFMNLPVISVAPQCHADSWFEIFEQLLAFADAMIHLPYVDRRRVYLIGASMGGYCTWQLAMTRPEWFAAIVPICGGGMYWNAKRLIPLGIWAFHGSEDPVVCCEESVKMVNAVNARGGNAKLTVFDGVGHNSWIHAFQSMEMWNWLLGQHQ